MIVLVSSIEICNYQPGMRGLKGKYLPRNSQPYSFSHDSLTVFWVHVISGTYCTYKIMGLIMLRNPNSTPENIQYMVVYNLNVFSMNVMPSLPQI